MNNNDETDEQSPIQINPAEISSLVEFAAKRGINTRDNLVGKLQANLERLETLDRVQKPAVAQEILDGHARLSRLAGGATGYTVRASLEASQHLGRLFRVTTLLLVLALGSDVLLAYLPDEADAGSILGACLWAINKHVIQPLVPFLWGGVGACIYILKRVDDEIDAGRFDPVRFRGAPVRIALGIVLGGVVAYFFMPTEIEEFTGDAKTLALLTGIGVKVVYGAIEKLIDTLAEKFNLGVLRGARRQFADDPVKEWLMAEFKKVNSEEDPALHASLAKLLAGYGR